MVQRIPFGLDHLPRALSPDDPRLPGVIVGGGMLRLNAEPLPPEVMALGGNAHATRVSAMKQHLRALCGDYAPQRQAFVAAYLDAMAVQVDGHRDELARGLQRFDGLYAPQDWLWSAPRPLPRAWLLTPAGMVLADIAFWDGTQPIAIVLGNAAAPDGVAACRIDTDLVKDDPAVLVAALPEGFRCFWRDEVLPRSPFRRPILPGVVGAAAAA